MSLHVMSYVPILVWNRQNGLSCPDKLGRVWKSPGHVPCPVLLDLFWGQNTRTSTTKLLGRGQLVGWAWGLANLHRHGFGARCCVIKFHFHWLITHLFSFTLLCLSIVADGVDNVPGRAALCEQEGVGVRTRWLFLEWGIILLQLRSGEVLCLSLGG